MSSFDHEMVTSDSLEAKTIPTKHFEQENVSFIALGDWGSPLYRGQQVSGQKAVAEAMGKWCDSRPCDFIISLGDNFYPSGVTSKNDQRFNTSWRNIYNQTSIANLQW